ncbi:P-loop containing nucleoside triphosphate hydrolase protein [Mycena pura]|uniref:P-loop containing nucleoside triphosphate hydrolase protein n=1 Tax=Mycena pura TaxID=153505 RepID=A0AAD6VC49_9AGAR|nr:P-loop containing nucleoside triphosphate hydrolase protein [Mycena pura]
MLPARPKIFHGRDTELKDIVEIICREPARIAILGAGGMGKTSLAKATLHHPDVVAKYHSCFFVASDSATTSVELAGLIGAHIGLKPGKDLTNPVVNYFSNGPACLLILDNLETIWEPLESRSKVEELLSVLTDIKHLALIITMRGAERPAKVHWTRPFLQPLRPLSNDAAWLAFVDIAEDFHNPEHIRQLLSLTDNLPLAVDLMAHLVDSEGCEPVLGRWETEKTSILSDGNDRRSNLDASITVSLSSPRMTSGAKDLLSLLAILPDGLSEIELLQSKLPINNVLRCKAILLATSLAYTDGKNRLKSLVPIREHMQCFYPAPQTLVHSLQKHFYLLLDLYKKHSGKEHEVGRVNQITSNLGNLHQVLLHGLCLNNPNLAETIYCTISLNSFSRTAGHRRHILMDHIPSVLSHTSDVELKVYFITEVLTTGIYQPGTDPEQLIAEGELYCCHVTDSVLQGEFSK